MFSTVHNNIKKILYISFTRTDYSLNSVLIKGLKENGVTVAELYLKDRRIGSFIKALSFCKNNLKNADALMVGYNSQLLIPLLNPFFSK